MIAVFGDDAVCFVTWRVVCVLVNLLPGQHLLSAKDVLRAKGLRICCGGPSTQHRPDTLWTYYCLVSSSFPCPLTVSPPSPHISAVAPLLIHPTTSFETTFCCSTFVFYIQFSQLHTRVASTFPSILPPH